MGSSSQSSSLNRILNTWLESKKRHLISGGMPFDLAENAVQDGYLRIADKIEVAVVEDRLEQTRSLFNTAVDSAIIDKHRSDGKDGHQRSRGTMSRSEVKRERERDHLRSIGEDPANAADHVAPDIYRTGGRYETVTMKSDEGVVTETLFVDSTQSDQFEQLIAHDFVNAAYGELQRLYGRYPQKHSQAKELLDLQLQGYGRTEIANLLGKSPNTIKNRLTQQRKDLAPVKNMLSVSDSVRRKAAVRPMAAMPQGCYLKKAQ